MPNPWLWRPFKHEGMLPRQFFEGLNKAHAVGCHLAHDLGAVHAVQDLDRHR